jgi:ankyrin repeat protein
MPCFVYRGLLKKPGLSVDVRDKFGNTPLIVACQNGHGRLAKMCVRYGADVNAVNHKKNTPLHFTAAATIVPSCDSRHGPPV